MKTDPISIERAVRRYAPVRAGELTLYPVRVGEYDEFLMARPALEVLHQSLPVAMMRVPLLSAYYRMDCEARQGGSPPTGLFARALLGLALSLRIGEGLDAAERVALFRCAVDRQDPWKLLRVEVSGADGRIVSIEPPAYRELRRVIAAQNGVKLESETANPDIVRARQAMNESGAKLEQSVDALVSFVCAVTGAEEREVDDWPILKLQRRADAVQTMLFYLVCGVGEASGATWKGGNPYPHPIFRRVDDGAGLASPMSGAGPDAAAGARVIEAQIKGNSEFGMRNSELPFGGR